MEERTESYRLVTAAEDLTAVAKSLHDAEAIGVDIETTALSPRDGGVRLLQLATPEETFVIDVFEITDLSPLREMLKDGPVKVGHNLKFDYQFLYDLHGISLSPVFDTMLAAQVLSGGNYVASYSLEAVAERYLDESLDKSEQRSDWSGELSASQLEYAARDARVLVPLRERLAEALEAEELGRISDIEFAAVASIAEMELAGVKLDVARWKELELTVRERRDRAAEHLESFFPPPEGVLPLEGLGTTAQPNSPKQITDAFKTLEIDPDTKVWTLLKVDHPAAKALLEYRELQKKLGTYLETYPNFISPKTGRIHANFLQCRVPTGRLACTAPNIQQIPHEDEFRRCFVAEEGNVLVISDYSQIELRILAEVSDDPAFVKAFQRGDDLHRLTAATMYNIPMEEVTRDQRSDAKRINFGLMYGRGARSLSAQLGTDEERGRQLIDEYFANYPKVQRYLQRTANRAMRDRTLRTLAGRVRKFGNDPVADDRGAMRREAMNFPIEGSASDIAKLALVHVREELEGLDARLINSIHDEFVIECAEEQARRSPRRRRGRWSGPVRISWRRCPSRWRRRSRASGESSSGASGFSLDGGIEIGRASPDDAEALTRIAYAAKRYWGYPERWISHWSESLTITPEFVRDNEVYAAVVGGEPFGFYALAGTGHELELDLCGYRRPGSALVRAACFSSMLWTGPPRGGRNTWRSKPTRTQKGST